VAGSRPIRMQVVIPALLSVLGASAAADIARAAPFNGAEAGLILGNTIPDAELGFLASFVGVFRQSLDYGVTSNSTSFTTTLSGTYGGHNLSLTDTGSLSGFPGAVTWTGSGTYGASTWSETGNASFSFPTASTFTLDFNITSLTLGANTGSESAVINGIDSPTVTFLSSSLGHAVADGDPQCTKPTLMFPKGLPPKAGDPTVDDELRGKEIDDTGICVGRLYITSDDEVEEVTPGPTGPILIVDRGSIAVSSLPEPAPLPLLAIALVGLGVLRAAAPRRN
jgi:hypothetical protein